MRKFIIICLLSFPVCALAQYHPFVSEGKVWIGISTIERAQPYMQIMKGDTLIGDKWYKKMYERKEDYYNDRKFHYHAAFRETEGKVYVVCSGSNQEYMLFDIGMKETGTSWVAFDNPETTFTLGCSARMSNDVINRYYDGIGYYTGIGYTGGDRNAVEVSAESEYAEKCQYLLIVEGIGFPRGLPLFDSDMRFYYSHYLNGYYVIFEDGDVAFQQNAINALFRAFGPYRSGSLDSGAVPSVEEERIPAFDLYGRKLEGVLQHGVYIRNGKKYIK